MVQSRHQVEECHATMLTMLNANKSSDDGDSCWAVVLVLCPGGFYATDQEKNADGRY